MKTFAVTEVIIKVLLQLQNIGMSHTTAVNTLLFKVIILSAGVLICLCLLYSEITAYDISLIEKVGVKIKAVYIFSETSLKTVQKKIN